MKSRAVIAIVLSAVGATACVRGSTTSIGVAGAPVSADSVRVFATQSPSEYTELAVLRVHRFLAGDAHVMSALRGRAAQLGANGILLLNTRGATGRASGSGVVVSGPRTGEVIVGNVRTDVDEFQRAVAIRYSMNNQRNGSR
jgi:hypothetical protein